MIFLTNNIRIYLIEDDFTLRKKMNTIIHSFDFLSSKTPYEVIQIEEFSTFFNGMDTFVIDDNDIFLIDIDLQTYFSGIDLAKKIRTRNPYCFILFLTNYEDKAIDIINEEIYAKSYLVKGATLDSEVFKETFSSIQSEILYRIQDKDAYASFKKFGETVFVKWEQIIYIKSISGMRNMMLIHTKDSEQVVEGTISKLKNTIDSPYLYTQLKSFIINLNHIVSLNYPLGIIQFDDLTELEVGKRILNKLKQAL